jgi:hypothetical protein
MDFFFLAISHIPVYSSSSVGSRMPSLVETGSRIETDFDFIQSVKSRMSSLVKTRSRIGTDLSLSVRSRMSSLVKTRSRIGTVIFS